MKLFGWEIKRTADSNPPQPARRRTYHGAKSDRLTADWVTGNQAADEILRWQLPTLRARCRDLAENNDYARNFFRKIKTNIVGPNGIGMQSKARLKNGSLDARANTAIEAAWRAWSKPQHASVCGTLSLTAILSIASESVARDGEVLIRKVRGYDNPFGFALQLIEADHLDDRDNERLANGNTVIMGVELNTWGKPVAYHIWEQHPGISSALQTTANRRLRIPAGDIIHVFVKERPTQHRGVPWMHTAIIRLRMLGAYEEAALVAARIGASKMGFYTSPAGEEYQGDDKDSQGTPITEAEPGAFETLPEGWDFKEWNPQYPHGEFPTFHKAMLRGIASGIGAAYNTLAGDLEGVNFSSIRSGMLDERDGWKVAQQWLITSVLEPVYTDWLDMAILSGQVPLLMADINRLNAPNWHPRTWDWVDPLKDIKARIEALNAGLTSRTAICAEQGVDFEDLCEQLAKEQELMKQHGITLPEASAGKDPAAEPQDDPDLEDEPAGAQGGNGNGKKIYQN